MMRILCWMERWVLSDTLMLSGSLNDNDKIGLDEDGDDNLDDVTETLDDVVGGDDVLEVDQDSGCSASTNQRTVSEILAR